MFYQPRDFQCPHKDSCPHLDWLSTKWVLGEYRRGKDVYSEHLRIIDRFYDSLKNRDERIRLLERENSELKAKLIMLHQKQFKANKKTGEAISSKDMENSSSSNRLKKKKRGAPVGHPGWVRAKPQHIDRTVIVPAPTICPYCGKKDLAPSEELREHIQEDIIINPRTTVTCFLHRQSFCTTCNRPVVCAGEGEILNAPIGPVAKSVALYLRYRIGISYRKTTELFRDLFGLKFVPASAIGFDRKASDCGVSIYKDLLEKIRVSDVVHADETSWRNDGVGYYVWFAGNEKLAYFHIDRHRSAEVAKGIFGKYFEGIIVRDRYAAYNGIGSQWQSCLAHIITKAKEIKREHGLLPQAEKDAATDRFCDRVIAFFKNACDTARKLNSGDISWESAEGIANCFSKQLSNIRKRPLVFKLVSLI